MVAGLAICVVLAALWFSIVPARAIQGSVDLVALDMDTTGNGDSLIGGIQPCGSIATVGGTLTFDLIVRGVDSGDRIKAYQVDIDYNPAILSVTSIVDADAAGSTAPDDISIISRINSIGGGRLPAAQRLYQRPWLVDGYRGRRHCYSGVTRQS